MTKAPLSPQEIRLFWWVYALPLAGCALGYALYYLAGYSVEPEGGAVTLFKIIITYLYLSNMGLPIYLPLAALIIWRIPRYGWVQNILIGCFLPIPVAFLFAPVSPFIAPLFLGPGGGWDGLMVIVAFILALIVGYFYVISGLLITLSYKIFHRQK